MEKKKQKKPTKNHDLTLQETHFSFKGTHKLNVRNGKRYSMQMGTKKECGWLVIADKIDFKS